MDLEQTKYLPNEEKQRYAELERLFALPGWARVMAFITAQRESAQQRELSAQTWDNALLNRGARFAFGALETFQEATEQEFAAIAQANAEREELQDESEHE